MALDFPAVPSDGDQYEGYVWNDAAGVWEIDNNFNYSDPLRLFQANPVISGDYAIPNGFNIMTIGPLEIMTDVEFTITDGSTVIIF